MNQRQVANSIPRVLLLIGIAAILGACGGGDGSKPALVGKSVVSYDISGVSESQKKALIAAGAEVTSTKCYPGVKKSDPGTITEDRIPAVLYVYQLRVRDLEAALALGFSEDYLTAGFSQEERSCASDPDTPANDIPANDTPADPA